MLLAALLGAGLLVGAQAQDFNSDKGSGDVRRSSDSIDVTDDIIDMYLDTNRHCVDDVVIRLHWEDAADLDLRVEGPDMCLINWENPLSKWGGLLVRDTVPRTCRRGDYEEIVRVGNGVANGGIWKIWAHWFSDGRCRTRSVDWTITVHMGGKLVDTLRDTLRKVGDETRMYHILGFRSHPTRKHNCVRIDRPIVRRKKVVRRKKGRSLLSIVRKDDRDLKCVCYHGKTVRHRGVCRMRK